MGSSLAPGYTRYDSGEEAIATKRGRGRPRSPVAKRQLNVTVSESIIRRLDEHARKTGISKNWFVSNLLNTALAEQAPAARSKPRTLSKKELTTRKK
jgi:hypothetical protein